MHPFTVEFEPKQALWVVADVHGRVVPRKLGGPSEKVRIQGLATGLMPEEKRQVRVTH